ncbi:MAG: hypothetical protein WC756_04515 [Taibaiella sp.]|jgi:hypothetical protein
MKEVSYNLFCVSIGKYENIRQLSKEEFDRHKEQIYALEKLELEDRLFTLITMNYNDLKAKIAFYCSYKDSNKSFDFKETYLDLNRVILNLLSSIRTYLDHNETRLKKKYGETSEEFQLFKRLTSNAFDTSFAYRFLTKLRNFAQHCGLPSGSIQQVSSRDGETIRLILHRDNLLNVYDGWGSQVKKDLIQQSEDFDMLPLIEQKISELRAINYELTEREYQKLAQDAFELLDLMVEVQKKAKGAPTLAELITDSTDKDSMQIVERHFPYAAISRSTGVHITILQPHKNDD